MKNALIALLFAAIVAGQPYKTRNVVIVTADGLRWQDLFGGIDAGLMKEKRAGMDTDAAKAIREKFWRDTPEARREALAPFFWKEVAPRGVLLGNVNKGSSVKVTNSFRVSYPGYSEILTGRAQDDVIKGNTPIQNPTPTILEVAREKLKLKRTAVALIGTWDTFRVIGEHTHGAVMINAGPQKLDLPDASPRLRELDAMQFDILTSWEGERHDYLTFEIGLAYLRQYQPRLLHIAFGETDDWAHARRYDNVLESISYFDRSLKRLWATLQSMPDYRDKTTLIVTSDHGRGATLEDFNGHGPKIEGANQIWMAVMGPDTPAKGEASGGDEVFQRDIAPTVLTLLGIDAAGYNGVLGHPIRAVLR